MPDASAGGAVEIGEAARRELVLRFERWLDLVLADEPPPRGIDAAILAAVVGDDTTSDGADHAGRDRVALFSALTTLVEETRLQGRAFKQLVETIEPLVGRGETTADRADDVWLHVVFDLYARLDRGREMCRRALECLAAPRSDGLLSRLRRHRERGRGDAEREAIEAIQEGHALAFGRLVEVLRDHGVTAYGAVGEPFDHHTMAVVDADPRADAATGTVLEVFAPGFRRHGEVLRAAKVKVASGGAADPLPDWRPQENST